VAGRAGAYAGLGGGKRPNLARVRSGVFGKAHQPTGKLAVDFGALLQT
jgi:hypothetical protein